MRTYVANITDERNGQRITETIAMDAKSVVDFVTQLIEDSEISDETVSIEISIGDGTEPAERGRQ